MEYAACIAQLACTAQAFLEQLQRRRLQHAAAAAGGGPAGGAAGAGGSALLLNYDEEMGHLRVGVERVVHDLLVRVRCLNPFSLLLAVADPHPPTHPSHTHICTHTPTLHP